MTWRMAGGGGSGEDSRPRLVVTAAARIHGRRRWWRSGEDSRPRLVVAAAARIHGRRRWWRSGEDLRPPSSGCGPKRLASGHP